MAFGLPREESDSLSDQELAELTAGIAALLAVVKKLWVCEEILLKVCLWNPFDKREQDCLLC